MSDNFWQDIKDILYDATNNEFYTEEERNEIIEAGFEGATAGFTTDASTIPLDFTSRQHTFYSPIDLVYWIEDSGIPPEYCYILRIIDRRTNSDAYRVFVSRSP